MKIIAIFFTPHQVNLFCELCCCTAIIGRRNNGSDEHERKRNLITSIIDTNNVKLCESFCSERKIKFITLKCEGTWTCTKKVICFKNLSNDDENVNEDKNGYFLLGIKNGNEFHL